MFWIEMGDSLQAYKGSIGDGLAQQKRKQIEVQARLIAELLLYRSGAVASIALATQQSGAKIISAAKHANPAFMPCRTESVLQYPL